LQRRGVAAWLRAWPGAAPEARVRGSVAAPAASEDELVGVLATMALARLAA
jgi:hypothetical protein